MGLEGVDWSSLVASIQAGGLPTLAALLRSGIHGPLTAPAPQLAASLWTALITGQYAHTHGVLHALEPLQGARGTGPVSRPTVRSATLAAILSASGLTVNQIGWPVSHPVEQLRGVAVSDRFAREGRTDSLSRSGGWPWITPQSAAKEIFARRSTPADVEEVALAQFVPANLVQQPTLGRLQEVCRAVIAESLTVFHSAKWSIQRALSDCTLCSFPAVSRLRQALGSVLSSDEKQLVGSEILGGCYEHLDMLLGQLIASAGEDTTIVLVGMGHSGSPQPRIVVQGPGLVEGATLHATASVLDITPTLLTLLGVAVAKDMDGQVWTSLLAAQEDHKLVLPEPVDTWSTCIHAPPQDSTLPANNPEPTIDESVRHLVELGYVDPLESEAKRRADECRRETRQNRARSLLDAKLHDEAIDELQSLKSDFPDWPAIYELLAEAYLQLGQDDLAALELEFLIHRGAESARLYFALGRIAASQRQLDEALLNYHVASCCNSELRGLQLAQGLALLRQRKFELAKAALQQALESEQSHAVLDAMATCCLGLEDYPQAAEYALAALDQNMSFAPAHYHLALALVGLDRAVDAKQALEVSVAIDANFIAPLRWLTRLCREHVGDSAQADVYQGRAREIIRQRRQARQANSA